MYETFPHFTFVCVTTKRKSQLLICMWSFAWNDYCIMFKRTQMFIITPYMCNKGSKSIIPQIN